MKSYASWPKMVMTSNLRNEEKDLDYLAKIKPRLGIDTNDTGFDEEIKAHIEDAETNLAIYVGLTVLTDKERALPSYWQYVLAYVIKAFKADGINAMGLEDLNRRLIDASINFDVEVYNASKQTEVL